MFPAFHWNLAGRMLFHARHAYHAATAVNVVTDTQALVSEEFGQIVVAFRGSSSTRDWLTNAQFTLEDLIYTRHQAAQPCLASVHKGFLRAFDSVVVELLHDVRNRLTRLPGARIYVTGHSLGGALATLCALDFHRLNLPVERVVTFGCPRVGNKHFARLYNAALGEKTFNLVNEGDPVPLVPTLALGYRDCGQEIFLRRNGAVEYNPFIGWEIFTDIFGTWRNWRKHQLGFIPNHSLDEYEERITRIIQQPNLYL